MRVRLIPRMSGGIRPPAFKSASLRSRIMASPIPPLLRLPLPSTGAGSADVTCARGDRVLKYQALTAQVDDTPVLHAPTSGHIGDVVTVNTARGEPIDALELVPDQEDAALELIPASDFRALPHRELLHRIERAGLFGLGGSAYPTARKLQIARQAAVHTLLINAAECEPYITADEALIRERAEVVVIGAEILQLACEAARCIIAMQRDKKDAIRALKAALVGSEVQLVLLPPVYPNGGERQLIQSVFGREVPAGQHPTDIGILVHNVGTAQGAHDAVMLGAPAVSRITTVTGLPLRTPKNFEALIGTPVAFLLEICGVDASTHTGTILGGSMMGIELDEPDTPLLYGTNCIIAKSAEEFPPAPPAMPCIRCSKCADVCPAGLLPQELYRHARNDNVSDLIQHGLPDCIECGACAYVCPSHIPLVQEYRQAKSSLNDIAAGFEQSRHWQERFRFHQYRLKRDAEDAGARPETKEAATQTAADFSREAARQAIADAVARVQAKRGEGKTKGEPQ